MPFKKFNWDEWRSKLICNPIQLAELPFSIETAEKKSNLIFDFFGSIISVVGNTQSEVMEPFRA